MPLAPGTNLPGPTGTNLPGPTGTSLPGRTGANLPGPTQGWPTIEPIDRSYSIDAKFVLCDWFLNACSAYPMLFRLEFGGVSHNPKFDVEADCSSSRLPMIRSTAWH